MGSFRGLNSIAMDGKGRMALPAKYRDDLLQLCDGNLVLTIDTESKCLLLYPLPEWEVIQQQLEALPSYNPATRRIQRLLIGHATDVIMDKQGRLLVPSLLREYASLDKQIALIGQGKRFEVWDDALWRSLRDEYLAPENGQAGMPEELSGLAL
ncbi:division/cell wall cluster transcriptional repressor MraZ [Pokkaliibacter sp. CJK22405]|uniref:division/cell wall cluster transcriptional repressor MraZ n=1 Tax=Pokkaliibacter sp. CJK22405 TaxID=3384615 RepID=UPI0039847986